MSNNIIRIVTVLATQRIPLEIDIDKFLAKIMFMYRFISNCEFLAGDYYNVFIFNFSEGIDEETAKSIANYIDQKFIYHSKESILVVGESKRTLNISDLATAFKEEEDGKGNITQISQGE